MKTQILTVILSIFSIVVFPFYIHSQCKPYSENFESTTKITTKKYGRTSTLPPFKMFLTETIFPNGVQNIDFEVHFSIDNQGYREFVFDDNDVFGIEFYCGDTDESLNLIAQYALVDFFNPGYKNIDIIYYFDLTFEEAKFIQDNRFKSADIHVKNFIINEFFHPSFGKNAKENFQCIDFDKVYNSGKISPFENYKCDETLLDKNEYKNGIIGKWELDPFSANQIKFMTFDFQKYGKFQGLYNGVDISKSANYIFEEDRISINYAYGRRIITSVFYIEELAKDKMVLMNKNRNIAFIFYRSNDEVLSILENAKPALSYDVLVSVGKAGNDMTLIQKENYSSEIIGVWQSERVTEFYLVFFDDGSYISLYNNKNYENDGKYQLSGTTLSRNWMKGKNRKYEGLEIMEFNKDKVVFKDGEKENTFFRLK